MAWRGIAPGRAAAAQPRRRVEELAAQRVMSAMLQVTKIDIAELERAYAAGA